MPDPSLPPFFSSLDVCRQVLPSNILVNSTIRCRSRSCCCCCCCCCVVLGNCSVYYSERSRQKNKITNIIGNRSLHHATTFRLLYRKRETKRLRKLLRISCLEHKTNDRVRGKINFFAGSQAPLLATVKRWKLVWFWHITRHESLSKTILQGTLESGRRRGRQRKCLMNNIKEWTTLPMPEPLTMAA